jgi:3',5'-cyclic AMP phosphodiesterase CpdA
LLALTWTLQAPAADSTSFFTILHITDIHLCKLDGYNPQLIKIRDHFGGYEPLRRVLTTVPSQVSADAVVITGDIIDFYEGESADGKLRAGQIEYFAPLAALVTVRLWMTLGNHDIQTHGISPAVTALSGGPFPSKPNPHAQVARAAWIRQFECFHEGTYYHRDVQVGATRWRLYFLDNGYKATTGQSRGTFWDLQQLEWLENELNQSPDRKAIFFSHIPLREGPPAADIDATEGIFKILNDHPSVVAAFVGHGHKNIVFKDIQLPSGHAVAQVETGGFGYDPNAWRTIKLSEHELTVSKPGSSEVDKIVKVAAVATAP